MKVGVLNAQPVATVLYAASRTGSGVRRPLVTALRHKRTTAATFTMPNALVPDPLTAGM
jgi:hypothetical protein